MAASKSSYNYEELLACARGELFGPEQCPVALSADADVQPHHRDQRDGGEFGKGFIRAELDIHPDLWFFPCHFIGDPVMPGCLGLDAMWQLSGFFLGWLGEPGKGWRCRPARSSSPAW